MTRDEAKQFTDSHLSNMNLRKHCYAAAFVMEALAGKLGGNPDDWFVAGMIHDADFELTKEKPSEHGLTTVGWLRDIDETNESILETVRAHNYEHTGTAAPKNPMEWSLLCADHLTGFIVAVALVRPEKTLAAVSIESILKKWNQLAFAAGTNRVQIALCEEKLGIPLNEFISIALSSMQEHHEELGL